MSDVEWDEGILRSDLQRGAEYREICQGSRGRLVPEDVDRSIGTPLEAAMRLDFALQCNDDLWGKYFEVKRELRELKAQIRRSA